MNDNAVTRIPDRCSLTVDLHHRFLTQAALWYPMGAGNHRGRVSLERDFECLYNPDAEGTLLPGTDIEIIRDCPGRGCFTHALFDFDGTISLIREGWQQVMEQVMVDALQSTPDCEGEETLRQFVRETIARTTGKQTIYQMMDLAAAVSARGGVPESPERYKRIYLDRLMDLIAGRREGLRSGRVSPEQLRVPGSLEFVTALKQRGLILWLASGTDLEFVEEESRLVGVRELFDGVVGATPDLVNSSKQSLITRLLQTQVEHPDRLLAFGDGYVEIDVAKRAGGAAVGVATNERDPNGGCDPWKRRRLLGAGADLIMPTFSFYDPLVRWLMHD